MKSIKVLLAVAAVFAAFSAVHYGSRLSSATDVPPNLRDAVADNSAIGQLGGSSGATAVPEPILEAVNKGYVEPVTPIEWVAIPGGKFTMGTTSIEQGFSEDAKPIREVTIKTFEMAKTAVTVEQYAECVSKGVCTKPSTGNRCNWGRTNRESHPVNCVCWNQAQVYAKFNGARLPSEAEFEYAATSGGRNQKYPWGNQEPTSELVVVNTNSTMPVCSKPKGNTTQGLCDMSGNVWQWMQDKYRNSYKGAPTDGSALEGPGFYRVFRGGSFYADVARFLRADGRGFHDPDARLDDVGFRLVR